MGFVKRCAREHCMNPVTGRRDDAIYCSDACKVAACKDRARLAAQAGQETAQKPIEAAIARLRPSARRIVRALEAAPRHVATTHQLRDPRIGGHRFSARLFEIRESLEPHGITIDRHKLPNQQCLYKLILPQLTLDVGVPAAGPDGPAATSSMQPGGGDANTEREQEAIT